MKRNDDIERRVLGICWLYEDEMRDLLVKDLVWKEGWLYAIHRWGDFEPYLGISLQDDAKAYEKYIWKVGERWVPVIAGQEQVLQQLIEGRGPQEHVFPEVHMPSRRVLKRLKRQYASRLYTMLSGFAPPIDNRTINGEYQSISRYEDAVYDVVHVLGSEPKYADIVAIRYIGQRSPRRRKGSGSSAIKNHSRTEQT
jgi:hypothetical protein